MAKYSGKDEKINGRWYPVTVTAIRGRFSKEENSSDWTKIKFNPGGYKKPKFRKDFVLKK